MARRDRDVLLREPLAGGLPAPENPLFLAVSILGDPVSGSYKSVASLEAIQTLLARGAGTTLLLQAGRNDDGA